MTRAIILAAVIAGLLAPAAALAHCPLCTAGAGILAVAAAAIGVSPAAIGVFIGAFAVALGLWAHTASRKFRFKGKAAVLAAGSFVLTVLPLAPLLDSYTSLFIPWAGAYGKTIVLNRFVVGAVLGAALLVLAPSASRALTALRKGTQFPFQGMTVTFALLLAASLAAQFIV